MANAMEPGGDQGRKPGLGIVSELNLYYALVACYFFAFGMQFVLFPSLVERLPPFTVPVLAGGFIRTESDVQAALQAGALGVTTSARALWGDGVA